MIQSFFHTSDNNNLYLYNNQLRISMLMHPEFDRIHKKAIDIDPYYLKKYAYLKKWGFFVESKSADFKLLEESAVRESIIHTKQIVFEATDSCNLNCKYCSLGQLYEGYDIRINKKINMNYAINLLKYIFELKPSDKYRKLYISFYGGEAMLNMDFIKKMVEITNQLNTEKKLQLEYSMTTNATLIDEHIEFLVKNKFRLLVSLDGNERNHSYRVFRKNKKNSFQKIIENLDMIQRDYSEYFSTHVNFNAVLHNRNSVKEIYEFVNVRYNKIPRISELIIRDIKSDNEKMHQRMFQSKLKSEVEFYKKDSDLSRITHGEMSLYRELTFFLKYFSINFYISNINTLLSIEEQFLPTSTCIPFSKKIFLTNRNKLLPCEKVNYKYSMGKVSESVEIDIPEITRQYNFYYEHIKKFCQICYAYRFCGTCLFQLKNIDNVNEEEFVCDNFYDQKSFSNKLHRIFSFLEMHPNDFSQILENVILE